MSEKTFVQIDKEGGVTVARILCPSVGQREAGIVESELIELGEKTAWRYVIDLTEVKMITSIGLGTFISLHRTCSASKGRIALFGLGPELMGLIKMTKLDRLLPVAKDSASAVSKVK